MAILLASLISVLFVTSKTDEKYWLKAFDRSFGSTTSWSLINNGPIALRLRLEGFGISFCPWLFHVLRHSFCYVSFLVLVSQLLYSCSSPLPDLFHRFQAFFSVTAFLTQRSSTSAMGSLSSASSTAPICQPDHPDAFL